MSHLPQTFIHYFLFYVNVRFSMFRWNIAKVVKLSILVHLFKVFFRISNPARRLLFCTEKFACKYCAKTPPKNGKAYAVFEAFYRQVIG